MSILLNLRRGDIYYADLRPNIGSEQGGIQPVVIIQNDIGNRYSPTTIVATISRNKKKPLPTHIPIPAEMERSTGVYNGTIMLEQVRTLDKSRLKTRVGHMPESMLSEMNNAIIVSCALKEFASSSMQSLCRGDIYYADLGQVVGSEQGGIRPVVIIQNNMGNFYSPTTIVATVTGSTKKPLPTHVSIPTEIEALTGLHESTILLEQVRTLDKRRLTGKKGCLPAALMQRVNHALNISFSLDD